MSTAVEEGTAAHSPFLTYARPKFMIPETGATRYTGRLGHPPRLFMPMLTFKTSNRVRN